MTYKTRLCCFPRGCKRKHEEAKEEEEEKTMLSADESSKDSNEEEEGSSSEADEMAAALEAELNDFMWRLRDWGPETETKMISNPSSGT